MADKVYIGKRMSFDGQLCTVRYCGEIEGTKGDWLGVEWDDSTRGKHSGEHNGIRYFECVSKQPTAGSFVRLARKCDPRRSFVQALKAKYASEDIEDSQEQTAHPKRTKKGGPWWERQNQPIRISGKEVEEVGFDKIRKQLADLHELRFVILDGLCMSRSLAPPNTAGSLGESYIWPEDLTDVKDSCPKTIELDLSRNLFEDWREIASICEQLDKLKSLRADGNRFRNMAVTEPERQRCLGAFANILTLKLEDTLLSWHDLTNITTLFPKLTTLVASSNLYTKLSAHYLTPTITDLTLEDNNFKAISDLFPITKLPELRRLVLKSNKISEIASNNENLPIFSQTVTEVDLSYNEIGNWALVDKLEQVFPGLKSLRVSHNPLYHSLQAPDGRALSPEDGYMLTIARVGNLQTLNYSPITEKERLNAESYYLSLIGREVTFAAPNLESQILASHPRYAYLCSEYGEPIIQRSANAVNPNSLAARLIRFTFLPGETLKNESSKEKLTAEIPLSFTAYSLLGYVGKKFDIPPMRCKLIWETGDWMPVPRSEDDFQEDWNSQSSDDDDVVHGEETRGDSVMREVEIMPGTRAVGTWIDGMEAVIRVELR